MLARALASAMLLAVVAQGCSAPRNPPPQRALPPNTVRCDAYATCSLDHGCGQGSSCIKFAGCLYATCVDPVEICRQVCGGEQCLVLDSAPGQMRHCGDGRPIVGE